MQLLWNIVVVTYNVIIAEYERLRKGIIPPLLARFIRSLFDIPQIMLIILHLNLYFDI